MNTKASQMCVCVWERERESVFKCHLNINMFWWYGLLSQTILGLVVGEVLIQVCSPEVGASNAVPKPEENAQVLELPLM
jgi:hypothetical protein